MKFKMLRYGLVFLSFSSTPMSSAALVAEETLKPMFHAPSRVEVRGLEGLSLDQWTKGFSTERSVSESSMSEILQEEDFLNLILDIYNHSSTVEIFYNSILKNTPRFNQKYAHASDYISLAKNLLTTRRWLRPSQTQDGHLAKLSDKRRGALLLLQFLAEETLYAGRVQFPGSFLESQHSILEVQFQDLDRSNCFLNGSSKKADLHAAEICQGDVLLSKGDALSSGFLARVTSYPGYFSHSATVYVSNLVEKPQFQLPEAEIQDGVKLRDPKNDYLEHHKRRLHIISSLFWKDRRTF